MPFAGKSLVETREVLELDDGPESADDGLLRRTPVLLEHCVDDSVVLIKEGRELRDTLKAFRMQVYWKSYSTGWHWFNSPRGMDDVVVFLNKHLLEMGSELPAEIH